MIWFIKNGRMDKEMEESLINMILENKIPENKFLSTDVSSIDFVGRKVHLYPSYYWTSINSIQCPYSGMANWGIHKDLKGAKKAIETQLLISKSKKSRKIISEEWIDIEFEGIPTTAKKVVLKLKGITLVLANMSGGESLTIYYVAENVIDINVSMVMSYWNNDEINPETRLSQMLS